MSSSEELHMKYQQLTVANWESHFLFKARNSFGSESISDCCCFSTGGENWARDCVLHFVSYFRPIPGQVQLIKGPSQAHPRNRGNRDSSLIPVISIKNHNWDHLNHGECWNHGRLLISRVATTLIFLQNSRKTWIKTHKYAARFFFFTVPWWLPSNRTIRPDLDFLRGPACNCKCQLLPWCINYLSPSWGHPVQK